MLLALNPSGITIVSLSRLAVLVLFFSGSIAAQTTSADQLNAEISRQRIRLTSTNEEDRRDAVMRLGALRSPLASREAASALTDVSVAVRVAAATAILSLPSDESAALLLPLLKDPDVFVRQEISYALGRSRSKSAAGPLIALLAMEKDSGVRAAAVVALGMIADETAVVTLAQILAPDFATAKKKANQDNEFVRRAAARSLGQIGSRGGLPALLAALQNEANETDVRREAATALGLIGDRGSIAALRNVMNHPDPYLAKSAYLAIRHIESLSQ